MNNEIDSITTKCKRDLLCKMSSKIKNSENPTGNQIRKQRMPTKSADDDDDNDDDDDDHDADDNDATIMMMIGDDDDDDDDPRGYDV